MIIAVVTPLHCFLHSGLDLQLGLFTAGMASVGFVELIRNKFKLKHLSHIYQLVHIPRPGVNRSSERLVGQQKVFSW